MKKVITSFLLFCLFSNLTFADCDWSKIKKNPDNTYTYSETLHLCVGQLVQDNKTLLAQNQDLTKALTLKDLALKASDDRATLWNNTATNLEARLQKVDSMDKKSEWIMFALGAATVIGAGFMASQLTHR